MLSRIKKHKIFWIWDYEKEEQWLNEMSDKGLQLLNPGLFTYTFEQGTPSEYIIRMELLDSFPHKSNAQDYIRFIEGSGAEYIGSVGRWVYFRQPKSMGSFSLFSDLDSRIKHLGRVLQIIFAAALVNAIPFYMNLIRYFSSEKSAYNNLLFFGILSGVAFLFLALGFVKCYRQRSKLKRERKLHE